MSNIIVERKPEDITWDVLALCQQQAHESNRANGVNMQCAEFSATDLQDAVKDGITLVAVDNKNALAGMLSVKFNEVKRWWYRGKAAYICYVAVAPEFKGKGVYKALSRKAEEIIISEGIYVEYLKTHILNDVAQRAYEKDGYLKVRFSPGSGSHYYSVEMAKWLDVRRKNKLMCNLMYCLTEIVVRILYKPGKIRRF